MGAAVVVGTFVDPNPHRNVSSLHPLRNGIPQEISNRAASGVESAGATSEPPPNMRTLPANPRNYSKTL